MMATCSRCVPALLILSLSLFSPRVAAADPIRIGVSYFRNNSARPDLDPLARGFADTLITDLSVSDDIKLVERGRLNEVLAEIKLQRDPYFDPKTAVKLGKGLGAAYLVTGSYLVSNERLRVDVRVVDVTSGVIRFTRKEEGKLSEFLDLEQRLARGLLTGLGARLTLIGEKRIGQASTKRFDAFREYCRSLVARDNRDARAERAALQAALAIDSSFAVVRQRLDAIESRVKRLEAAGGLILSPRSAADHYHNATLHDQAGRTEQAVRSLVSSLAADPGMMEPWVMLSRLRPKQSAVPNGISPPAGLAKAIRSFLSKSSAGLWEQMGRAAGADKVAMAVLLFERTSAAPPLPTVNQARMLLAAVDTLLAAPNEALLPAHLINGRAVLERARRVREDVFTGDRLKEVREGVRPPIRDAWGGRFGWWRLMVFLQDRPSGPITINIDRQPRHPAWKEKAFPPEHLRRLRFDGEPPGAPPAPDWANRGRPAAPSDPAVLKHVGDARKLIYRVPASMPTHPGVSGYDLYYSRMSTERVADLGATITVSNQGTYCAVDRTLVTGSYCQADVELFKANLVPGCYAVSVSYQDSHGAAVRENHPLVYAPEFRLAKRVGLNPMTGSVYPRDAVFVCPAYSVATRSPEVDRKWQKLPYPLKTLFFDVDSRANGGTPPPDDDPKAWRRYRDAVVRHGHRARAEPFSCQELTLPSVSLGDHRLCVVGERTNGSKSPEPDCLRFRITE